MIRLLGAACFMMSAFLPGLGADLEIALKTAGGNADEIRAFVAESEKAHGEEGKRAAEFLVAGMPTKDLKSLDSGFLIENLTLAFQAREEFPWATQVPEEVFLNDVLPYASLDETRESWRPDFYAQCKPLVKDCKTAAEAAQVINRDFFNLIKVHYNTGRKAPNQSPSESKALGMATCTGLSIILVDACRSVGVPARIAGTALWANKRGNHTWVEIHDRDEWFFTGADEYDKKGLNRAWFTKDASQALEDDWKQAIWASSWKRTGSHFPLVWNLGSRDVPAVNVTARYVTGEGVAIASHTRFLRLWDRKGGERMVAEVEVVDADGVVQQTVTTKGGKTDLNDMPEIKLLDAGLYRLQVNVGGEMRAITVDAGEGNTLDLVWSELEKVVGFPAVSEWLKKPADQRSASFPKEPLSKDEADLAIRMISEKLLAECAAGFRAELDAKVIKVGGKEMKYLEKSFGEAKEGERSLWISMHGGGGAPARVNDQQWRNQIRLYAPEEGVVVAPRAPTNTWNLWHEGHIDDLFQRLIDAFVCQKGVSPDRVYLMGYSAGGDGVYQLAPRMADRFAAAAMMAGHPNDAKPLGLRNLPFMIFMGGRDGAYDRNKVAAQWGRLLEDLKKGDPAGYEHKVTIYDGLGHWMNGRDREALPWMAEHVRDAWPKKVVWRQSNRTHDRFYWLSVPRDQAKGGQVVRAEVKGQEISIQTTDLTRLRLRLSDALLDLDKPVRVLVNGEEKFNGPVQRKVEAIWKSLEERKDPRSVATATVDLNL
ncbi:MAG: transglutaminase domain-containing protein [Haloferula sp.]